MTTLIQFRTAARLMFLPAVVAASAASAADKIEYNRDIRPILIENCFACHGADSAARKAGFRLDVRESAIKKGAITAGNPAKSTLLERVHSADAGEVMPPPKTNKRLTPAQKELLKKWIAAGAEYQSHWSFIAPTRPAPPAVKDQAWVRNAIDRFVLAELEKRGLKPAIEADRRTLARRLALDLTGLPPEPADVEAFVADKAADAYEKYVDKMLASPHWGEHRGRYWLDAARYADTHGIHFDNYREMWAYRDWVIAAFNRNVPFDRFTIEQLAGDLLPNRTMEQQVASGFNRCNITTNEGGAIAEEYIVLYARDRTETTSQVWMGLTAGCAVCHDHKFDPLTTKDFYSLSAFFNNTTQNAMDGNIKDTPPILLVPQAEDRPRYDAISKELAAMKATAEGRKKSARKDFDAWAAKAKAEEIVAKVPTAGLTLHAALTEGKGDELKFAVAGKARTVKAEKAEWEKGGHLSGNAFVSKPGGKVSVAEAGDFDWNQPFSYGAWVRFPRRGMTGAIFSRMDNGNNYRGWDLWVQSDLIGAHIVSKWPEDAIKVVAQTPIQPRVWYHVFVTYDGSGNPDGLKVWLNGQVQPTTVEAKQLRGTIKTDKPFRLAQRDTSERLDNVAVQDVRIYGRNLPATDVMLLARSSQAAAVLAKPADKRTPKEKDEIFDWWLSALDESYAGMLKKMSAAQAEEVAIRARGTVTHVMQERGGEPAAFTLFRGEYDKRRDAVKAAVPTFLPGLPADLPKNRLGMAQWLLRPEHPLTARVTVNRFWQELFGNGIVKSSGDFGISGDLPTHPELLDWMAVEFREGGWDIKRFFKLLVTSATYRQAAITTAEKLEKDQHNRLMSRGARFRMDGEMIRDYALAASGILVRKLGGPSVKPYQPEGVWEAVAMIGSNTRDYRRDTGDKLYRRSLYTFWKRSAPPASMDIFNAPNRETCVVRRERTNTPLQALVTLNDVQFVEAARHLAQRALTEGGDKDESRLDFVARRLLARPLTAAEGKIVAGVLGDLKTHYLGKPEEAKKLIAVGESKADAKLDPAVLAAWTMTVNQLMNLDEVLNK